MKFSIAAALVALAASVNAQANIISITSPLTGTVYTAGSDAVISWVQPTVSTISKIVLAKGSPTALQPVATIAQDIDANAGSYVWSVPSDLAAGVDYALEFGDSPNISFTGLFTIQNDGSAPAATAAATGAEASASASESASASASDAAQATDAPAVAKRAVAESGALKISSAKAAMGAIAVAGAAAAALM